MKLCLTPPSVVIPGPGAGSNRGTARQSITSYPKENLTETLVLTTGVDDVEWSLLGSVSIAGVSMYRTWDWKVIIQQCATTFTSAQLEISKSGHDVHYLSTSMGSAGAGVDGVAAPFGAVVFTISSFSLLVPLPESSCDGTRVVSTFDLLRKRSGTPRAAVSAGPTKQPSMELQVYSCDIRRRI